MSKLKKSICRDPDAQEYCRYLKEKKVLPVLQPALTLLYKLPIKPANLYEFFAEYLENGAETLVKLSLLRAEHCYIKNEVHTAKRQVRQLKDRLEDAEEIIQKFQDGTNHPPPVISPWKDFNVIDRFFDCLQSSKVDLGEDEIDEVEDLILKAPAKTFEKDLQKQLEIGDLEEEFYEESLESEFEDEGEESEVRLMPEASVIGDVGSHENRKKDRKLVLDFKSFRDEPNCDGDGDGPDKPNLAGDDIDSDGSTGSLLNIFNGLDIQSRANQDHKHRKYLHVLRAKKSDLLSGKPDLSDFERCHLLREKQRQKKQDEEFEIDEEDESKLGERGKGYVKTKKPEDKEKKNGKKYPHGKHYRGIQVDPMVVNKEKQRKLLAGPTTKEIRQDKQFLDSLGPNHWTFTPKASESHNHSLGDSRPRTAVSSTKLRTNADFVYDFPLDNVREAQQWIDENFVECVFRLNEPLGAKDNSNDVLDDDDDNYEWLDDYKKGDGHLGEILSKEELALRRMTRNDKKHLDIEMEREFYKETCFNKRVKPIKIVDEDAVPRAEPVASVPSLLKVPGLRGAKDRKESLKLRSERTKEYVNEMFHEKYGERLMNQFEFDLLDD